MVKMKETTFVVNEEWAFKGISIQIVENDWQQIEALDAKNLKDILLCHENLRLQLTEIDKHFSDAEIKLKKLLEAKS